MVVEVVEVVDFEVLDGFRALGRIPVGIGMIGGGKVRA